ncbi:MAG: hypothetical protein ABWY55_09770 [Microbacterium sp.]
MDAPAWIVMSVALAAVGIAAALAPRLKRDNLRRQLEGGGSFSGVGAGFDAVWRPSAEEAHAQWQAQVEVPAPAPTPGDKGRVRDGRIVIDLDDAG